MRVLCLCTVSVDALVEQRESLVDDSGHSKHSHAHPSLSLHVSHSLCMSLLHSSVVVWVCQCGWCCLIWVMYPLTLCLLLWWSDICEVTGLSSACFGCFCLWCWLCQWAGLHVGFIHAHTHLSINIDDHALSFSALCHLSLLLLCLHTDIQCSISTVSTLFTVLSLFYLCFVCVIWMPVTASDAALRC